MDLYAWLLAFHVIAAFMTIASVVVFGALLAATLRGGDARSPVLGLWNVGFQLWNVGGLAVLVLGVILAVDNGAYQPWDGWLIAAYVLWAIAGFAGSKTAMRYREAHEGGGTLDAVRSQSAIALYALMATAVALLLAVMIWKPGV